MRVPKVVFSIFFAFVLTIPLAGQQTTTSNPQALPLLQRSLNALSGAQTLTDVTLSGTARRIAGSDDDTGTAVFKALLSGAARTDLSLSSGQRTEVCDLSATTPAGAWSRADHISHPIAFHNLLSEPAWFFPAFAIARRLSGSGYVVTYVGHETHNGQAVEHVSMSQQASGSPNSAALFQHLSQVEIYLDSTTLLPAGLSFNVHPDNNALLDMPIEVQFSDYRAVNGTQVPYHVQKFLNNSLLLDFQVQTVTLNTGLAASAFSVQ